MQKLICLSAIGILLLTIQSCNDSRKARNYNQQTLVDDQGYKFILAANEANVTEIKAATLAENNSKNPRVIDFAKMMITDHVRASDELKDIAVTKRVNVVDTMSLKHKAMLSEMMKLTGSAFDKAYMKMMETDHSKVIQLFHDVSENTDKKLKDFSNKAMPVLKLHLDSARAIGSSLK
ncbi:putative membrane protein [Mucilaginibacter polytrichastri]|nr:putative membrane protein [Mucilaginibacter polytrichastri]